MSFECRHSAPDAAQTQTTARGSEPKGLPNRTGCSCRPPGSLCWGRPSMAAPASGPTGAQVAERLRPFVAELLGVPLEQLPEETLESLSARVERTVPHRFADLKVRAAEAADFLAMDPNFGHEVVALLMREGALSGISVNWDRGVENAGVELKISIEGVASASDRQRLSTELPLFKVHGCARRPKTLAITQAEVDRPQGWAKAEVQHALAGGTVVFLGLGTVGVYVREPLVELAALWQEDGVTIRVVDPFGLSPGWRAALNGYGAETEIALDSESFLDDLLRAIVLEAISLSGEAVRRLRDGSEWPETMLSGFQAVRQALTDSPADAALRWWRDGVVATQGGRPFILDHAGRQSFMAVALLAGQDGGNVAVEGLQDQLVVRTDKRYFEIACRPGERFFDIERTARNRIERRSEVRRYESGIPVFVVVHGGVGTCPSALAPPDIGAECPSAGDVGVETGLNVHLVRAEAAVCGEIAA